MKRIIKKILNHWGAIFLVYATFIFSLTIYVSNRIHYRDISDWPSVPVQNLHTGGETRRVTIETVAGGYPWSIDYRYVEFDYTVNGVAFHSRKASPDGGGLPPIIFSRQPLEWRAFYNPKNPKIAVLNPVPYQGVRALITMLFSGLIVALHLLFTFKET